jgi:hypothetical protein
VCYEGHCVVSHFSLVRGLVSCKARDLVAVPWTPAGVAGCFRCCDSTACPLIRSTGPDSRCSSAWRRITSEAAEPAPNEFGASSAKPLDGVRAPFHNSACGHSVRAASQQCDTGFHFQPGISNPRSHPAAHICASTIGYPAGFPRLNPDHTMSKRAISAQIALIMPIRLECIQPNAATPAVNATVPVVKASRATEMTL